MGSPEYGFDAATFDEPVDFNDSAEDLQNANSQDYFGLRAEAGTTIGYQIDESPERKLTVGITSSSKQLKRPHSPSSSSEDQDTSKVARQSSEHSSVIASHYNNLDEKGLFERSQSRIFFMRNFNNWIKGVLIQEFIGKTRESLTNRAPIRVLDMCCGKGGDLFKWQKANITHLICTDIAGVSIEQCESRYKSMPRKGNQPPFTAEFFACDSTNVRLREHYKDPSIELNLVSCQFAFHYCFESLKQAECMIKNAAECLRAGGYFIGTIPDANDIMKRHQQAKSKTFGNDIYQVNFLCDAEYPPLFGAKYNFQLDGVVNCPEFLVYFPLFVKIARKYGLELVMKERFEDYFDKNNNNSSRGLLEKMQALETYPGPQGRQDPNEFAHVAERRAYKKLGTLSKSEWEVVSLYQVFAFRKMKKQWNSRGEPEFV